MKKLKSHFWYTKNQRNGIFLLILLIVGFQLVYRFVDFSDDELFDVHQTEVATFQMQLDSLKEVALEERKPKKYPFNPNYITDYKGYQLGMSTKEIDRLLAYREKGLFVNSSQESQKITKISDRLLTQISPSFKFPDWVVKKNKKQDLQSTLIFNKDIKKRKATVSITDINVASQNDFESIEGVSESLAERIVKYRTKLQGYSIPEQIFEVWGLEKEIAVKILNVFSIKSVPVIKKTNVNTASFKEVLAIPYIDYDLCVKIFDYRDEVAELQSISELKNIEDFPMDKYKRIILYLLAQ
ncbi:MAG: helix-hairpin-helix domain-containing protein [Flavobacteriaceae bacterium]|nr:helix-hairpin-helix domain-containing protein [Flavobacteriaceae bacterium]